MNENKKKLSKFLAFVLRHQPETANLQLDKRGFCSIASVLEAATKHLRFQVTLADLEELSQPSPNPNEKTRFEIEGDFIRAGHGHSISISGYRGVTPTAPLYHAAPQSVIQSIRNGGLKPMARDKVHLSYDKAITKEAARRRENHVVVVEVDVEAAMKAGKSFYQSADPRIILSDFLEPKFLRYPDHPEWNPVLPVENNEKKIGPTDRVLDL